MFKPVERESLVEVVAGQIRELVLNGVLKPEEKLPSQGELCTQFGVSRSCVREAVRLLEGYGLLETRSGAGTFVRSRSQASRGLLHAWSLSHDYSLEEFLQVRMALEGTTAALAAQRATLPQVAAIRRGLDAMRQAAADTDWDGLIQSEVIFHRALLEASNNTLLLSLLANLTAWLTEVGRAVRSIPDRRYDVVALH